MVKLAVGIRDVTHLRQAQAARASQDPPLRHRTRNFPRRSAEIIAGGSMYWVVAGAIVVRQRITDVIADQWEDGTACAGLVLDPTLVPVAGRPTRAFQGWRYLEAEAAPADLGAGDAVADALPAELRRTLQGLGLL